MAPQHVLLLSLAVLWTARDAAGQDKKIREYGLTGAAGNSRWGSCCEGCFAVTCGQTDGGVGTEARVRHFSDLTYFSLLQNVNSGYGDDQPGTSDRVLQPSV
jgi:hypothetical protein